MPPRPLLWGMGGRFQVTSDLHSGDTPPYELFGLCGASFGLTAFIGEGASIRSLTVYVEEALALSKGFRLEFRRIEARNAR